jgi:uncharacterized protein
MQTGIEKRAKASATPKKERPPLIHRFQTVDHYYVYDANTNRILQVDQVMWDLLGLEMGWSELVELKRRLPQYNLEDIQAAAQRCEQLNRTAGVFSSFRPEGMRRIDPNDGQRAKYERGLEQIIIEITQACNLRCEYCSFSAYYPLNRSYTGKSIDFATARKTIDYFLDRVADTEEPCIGFYGGEPLMRFELLKRCIDYAFEARKGAPLRFSLTTNGTLITADMVEYFADRSVSLLISLDGPPKCHDQNRLFADGRPTSSVVLNNLDIIKRTNEEYYKKNVGITSVIASNTNPRDFFEFFKEHPDIVGNGILLSSFVNDTNTDYWEKKPPSQQWCQSLEMLRWDFYQSMVLGNQPHDKFLENLFRPDFLKIYRRGIHKRLPSYINLNGCCLPGVRRLYVDCDGRFHMCERINDTIPIGDVKYGIDPERITQLVDEYRTVSEKDCCDCWLVRLCLLCFASCVKNGSFDIEHKQVLCKGRRESFHQSLVDYCQIAEINPAAFKYMDDIVIK